MSMSAESSPSADVPHRFQVTAFLRRDQRGVLLGARDLTNDTTVGLRQIDLRQFDIREREAYCTRLSQQIARVSDFHHPAVLRPHSLYVEGDDAFIVMDPMEDARPLEERGVVPVETAISLVSQALDVLSLAHDRNLDLHDLQLRNFLVTPFDDLRVLEFGITPGDIGDVLNSALARPEDAGLMSPEQAVGEAWEPPSNLFSVGCLLYLLLAGKLPFQAETYTQTVAHLIERPHQSLSNVLPDLPAKLDAVIDRALAKSPADRFQDARTFRHALLDAVNVSVSHAESAQNADANEKIEKILRNFLGPSGAIVLRRGLHQTSNRNDLITYCADYCADARAEFLAAFVATDYAHDTLPSDDADQTE